MVDNKNNLKALENILIPIEPLDDLKLNHEKINDWDFFWSVERMLSSKELDMIGDKVKINRLPEMLFGYNRFYLVNSKNNFLLEINPLQMLDLCNYEERKKKYLDKNIITENKFDKSTDEMNFVYYIPGDVKVQYYNKWKNIKVDREDVKIIDATEDWTFSSPYMGNIARLTDNRIFDSKCTNIFSDFDTLKQYNNPDIKFTDENLPVNRLGQENPILNYIEINLYDDELCDNGVSMGNFR
jgi:hypothetical protein